MLLQKPTSRRKFLLASLMALPLTELVLKGLTAAEAAELAAPDLSTYQPHFFTAEEWQFILAATDRLIPAGGQGKAPGALETNVPIFIDQQLHDPHFGKEIYMQGPFPANLPASLGYQIPYYPQQIYQLGIAAIDQWCQQQHSKSFVQLSHTDQQQVLALAEKGTIPFGQRQDSASLTAAQFFSQLLNDTKHGYLADPMYGGNKGMKAWIAIGFPGARASYLEWVKQHNVQYPLGPVSIQSVQA